MKKKYLCVECAHKHSFIVPNPDPFEMAIVYIDGEPYTTLHRSSSQAVRCSECGKKSNSVFEPFYQVKHKFEI